MLLLDTGARRSEVLNLRITDVNLGCDVIHVLGKGGRQRVVPFGRRTATPSPRPGSPEVTTRPS
jgi:site-specific recombinase XerD